MTDENAFFLDVEKAFEKRDAFGGGELTFDRRLEGFARVLFEGFEIIGHRLGVGDQALRAIGSPMRA